MPCRVRNMTRTATEAAHTKHSQPHTTHRITQTSHPHHLTICALSSRQLTALRYNDHSTPALTEHQQQQNALLAFLWTLAAQQISAPVESLFPTLDSL